MRRPSMKIAALGVTAALMIGGMGITPAWAYFTDTHEATGGMQIKVAPDTDITEEISTGDKHIVLSNKETSSVPVFMRARVFYGSDSVVGSIAGDDWSLVGDWYYFDEPVQPGGVTSALVVEVDLPSGSEVSPSGDKIEVDHSGESFSVVVVYEAVPVQYDQASGQMLAPWDADWTMTFKGGE